MRDCCPCNGCVPPKRHEACHDHCEEYIEWKQPIIDSYAERAKAVDRRMINDIKTKQNIKRK